MLDLSRFFLRIKIERNEILFAFQGGCLYQSVIILMEG